MYFLSCWALLRRDRELSRRHRRLYAYAQVAFGPVVGGIAGTLIWAANSVVPNAVVSNLLVDTLAAEIPGLGNTVPRTVILAVLSSLFVVVNVRSARHGTRLSALLCVIKILPLVALVVVGSFAIHGANLHWVGTPSPAKIGESCVLVFFAFMGTEGALGTSGEVINPARTVPRAIVLALTLVATLYIGLQLVAQGVLGPDLATSKAPLVDAALVVFGPWGERLIVATIVISVIGYLAASRTEGLAFAPPRAHAVYDALGFAAGMLGVACPTSRITKERRGDKIWLCTC